ncbi:hypothetical protein HMI54_002062 [Coelomomyces lativittatus]|nr:hypothetical protein HMI54_002062 [Coelomomyces lativittatus]
MTERESGKYPPSMELLSKGLSMLGQSPSGQEIVDVKFLENYPNLEYLELPCNRIADVSVLAHLPFLYSVDLSSNRILSFNLPSMVHLNLQHLDLSRNQLSSIEEIGVHKFLKQLCLDHNLIRQIRGLDTCTRLTTLSLVNNAITSLSGLAHLPIKHLDLSWNHITDITETQFLPELEHLILNHNQINSLEQLSFNCRHLSHLDVSFNLLSEISQLLILINFPLLSSLSCFGNLFTGISKIDIRPYLLFHLSQLSILDGLPTSEKEKVNSKTFFSPSPEIMKAFSYAKETVEELHRFAIVQAEPCKFASIVLFGPKGGSKRSLSKRLVHDFPHLFAAPILHTTRPPHPNEVNGVDYYFVSNDSIQQLKKDKKMVFYSPYDKYTTAMSIEACQRPLSEGKMGIFVLNIDEAICLHQSGIVQARYFFIAPPVMLKEPVNQTKHINHDVRSRLCSEFSEMREVIELWSPEIKETVSKQCVLKDDFFESLIINNEFESCYDLVKDAALKELVTQLQNKYIDERNAEI